MLLSVENIKTTLALLSLQTNNKQLAAAPNTQPFKNYYLH